MFDFIIHLLIGAMPFYIFVGMPIIYTNRINNKVLRIVLGVVMPLLIALIWYCVEMAIK